MIARLLDPLLNLHGWEVYSLVGALVFAEASILIGFVFPGETAVILGGVSASRGHVNIAVLIAVVVSCAIAGDSVGYAIGEKWGRRLLGTKLLRKRRRLLDGVFDQLNRRGAVAVFVSRFTAFLRAVVPGLAGISSMPYRVFLPANAAGGLIWGTGTICSFVAAYTPMVGPATSFSLSEGNTMISAAWGVFVWKEFRGASGEVRRLLALMFTLFVLGLVSISLAPVLR